MSALEQPAVRIELEARSRRIAVCLQAFQEKAEHAQITCNLLEFRPARFAFELRRSEIRDLGTHTAHCQDRLFHVQYGQPALDLVKNAVYRRQRSALCGVAE